jgi:hypothetical protein
MEKVHSQNGRTLMDMLIVVWSSSRLTFERPCIQGKKQLVSMRSKDGGN